MRPRLSTSLWLGLAACTSREVIERTAEVPDGVGFFLLENGAGVVSAPRGPVVVEGRRVTSGADQIPDEEVDHDGSRIHLSWMSLDVAGRAVASTEHRLAQTRLSDSRADFQGAACARPYRTGDGSRIRIPTPSDAAWQVMSAPDGSFEPSAGPAFATELELELPIDPDPCALEGVALRPFAENGFHGPLIGGEERPHQLARAVRLDDDVIAAIAGPNVLLLSRTAAGTASIAIALLDGDFRTHDLAIEARARSTRGVVVGFQYRTSSAAETTERLLAEVSIAPGRVSIERVVNLGKGELLSAVFLDDGSYLVSGSRESDAVESAIVLRSSFGGDAEPFAEVRDAARISALTIDSDGSVLVAADALVGKIVRFDSDDGREIERWELGSGAITTRFRRFAPFANGQLLVGPETSHIYIAGGRADARAFVLPPAIGNGCPADREPKLCEPPTDNRWGDAVAGSAERIFLHHDNCRAGLLTSSSDGCATRIEFDGLDIDARARAMGCEDEPRIEDIDFYVGARIGAVVTAVGSCGMVFEACLEPSRCGP
ncbi:MAG: hypothetical protein HYV07_28475 [Deltaproteobacteria bacterium]|nr:hypothetical protein [Deltaproteobacteria bacterium]